MIGILALGLLACEDRDRSAAAPGSVAVAAATAPAPARDDPPLLLDEELPLPDSSAPVEGGADNTRCHVCHANYEDERLALAHASCGIGCQICHGDSSEHCANESNVVAPDVMYGGDGVNTVCHRCHPELSRGHVYLLTGIDADKRCTDCHDFGGHRLVHRTRRWDKRTRELVMSDNVRM